MSIPSSDFGRLPGRLGRIVVALLIYLSAAAGVGLVVFGCTLVVSPITGTGITLSADATPVGTAVTLSVNFYSPRLSCTASNDWAGATDAANNPIKKNSSVGVNTNITVNPAAAGIYTYTVNCKDGTAVPQASSVQLNVYAPPTLGLTQNPITAGGTTTLNWTASNAQACTPQGTDAGWTGSKVTPSPAAAANGSYPISTNASASYPSGLIYGLQCTETDPNNPPAGTQPITSQATPVTLTVNPAVTTGPPATNPVQVNLTVTTTSILAGSAQAVKLNWTTLYATSCTATMPTGSDPAWLAQVPGTSGTYTVPAAVTQAAGVYTYGLTCTGNGPPGGGSATLTVYAVPTVSLSVSPLSITLGNSAQLNWTSSNATACTASDSLGDANFAGPEPLNGTAPVMPGSSGTVTYTLSCTGPAGGQMSSPASLTVAAATTLSSISVSPPSAVISVPMTQQFTVTGHNSDGSTQDLTSTATWTTSNNSVATVGASGLATAVAAGGPVTLTASVVANGQTLTATTQLFVTSSSAGLACNSRPSPAGGGADAWDNQSFCVNFSGMTDGLYNFSGTLTFTTPLTPGAVVNCSFASSGTVNLNSPPTPATTGPTPCTGSTTAGSTTLTVTDGMTNTFNVTFAPNGSVVDITGSFNFGEFGPGFGIAGGGISGIEE
jgi:trimeric autotransporter adhesin